MYAIISNVQVYGTDIVKEQSPIQTTANQTSRIPSLKNIILSKFGSLLIN